MKIHEVIRTYRKEKGLTQEEMARRLGVSAPAVNKWENGVSLPDVSLLAPIARLLGISTDTLLSYEEELSGEEINALAEEACRKLQKESYDEVFAWGEEKLREYPNCEDLLLTLTTVLDGYRSILGISDSERYEEKIEGFYLRLLDSKRAEIAEWAVPPLFYRALDQKEFDKAQAYLNRIPLRQQNPKRFQAVLYKRKGEAEGAYRCYEELLWAANADLQWAFDGLMSLALEEGDLKMAEYFVGKLQGLARLLEMGRYMEAAPALEVAVKSQDVERTLAILEEMADHVEEMQAFQQSKLFAHIPFSEGGIEQVVFMLRQGLKQDGALAFLQENARFQKILEKIEKLEK